MPLVYRIYLCLETHSKQTTTNTPQEQRLHGNNNNWNVTNSTIYIYIYIYRPLLKENSLRNESTWVVRPRNCICLNGTLGLSKVLTICWYAADAWIESHPRCYLVVVSLLSPHSSIVQSELTCLATNSLDSGRRNEEFPAFDLCNQLWTKLDKFNDREYC